MSFDDREFISQIAPSTSTAAKVEGWEDISLPPGEESMFLSHEGGESELINNIFLEDQSSKRKDGRGWRDRVHIRNHDWMAQREELIRAYLEYRAGREPMESEELEQWEFVMVDFFSMRYRSICPAAPTDHINPTLLRHGYIGSAPLRPSVAVSLDVLEAYRQQHRVCPRFGLQAQVKALCYLHQVPFNRSLVEQLNVVFDVYLEILHGVDMLVNNALGRNTPNWRMLNVCAPCLYALEGEESLKPKLLACMDGNQSLKLVDETFWAGTAHLDHRTARTDIWRAY
ncbi:uncharacterized protein B0H18DRAFT_882536 [Fomitopsis serialis]|uniref:uncharacterized protein n=1 Tax=Fomitopsis serialis TaxID=139415 RepID=UPI00200798FA|nr:uncharacterized protein B0H18DRAFT_882536 [Neoantrodia serialis]KAH9918794.1 hypothetical protein B0H18DRAFT_882536 [Neoantrodia serialis]